MRGMEVEVEVGMGMGGGGRGSRGEFAMEGEGGHLIA